MCKPNDMPLSLKSDTFNAMTTDYEVLLRRLLETMEDQETDEGEITIKVKVRLTRDEAPDFEVTAYNATREVIKPKFEHTITATTQYKDKKTGVLSGNYELIYDKETHQYVMRPIVGAQTTLYDNRTKDDSIIPGVENLDRHTETPMLEGRQLELLPPANDESENKEDGYIDAEYTDVEDGCEDSSSEESGNESSDAMIDEVTDLGAEDGDPGDDYEYEAPERGA